MKNAHALNAKFETAADTIAAIATAPGAAGIAIVRVSGPKAIEIARKIFICEPLPALEAKRLFRVGYVKTADALLDQVILLVMRGPHSYTGEDVVEFQGHGGSIPARRLLQLVLNSGARHSEPGEFTRRAFLNGRLDLMQAEAVLDLIQSRSERAASAAVEQLTGKLSTPLNAAHNHILEAAANLEVTLDFLEDETPVEIFSEVESHLTDALKTLNDLLATWEEGQLLREGALVVIAGRPNVGKSTLLNQLLGRERAIVSPHPGTTRDLLEETWILDGYPLRLVDTAGLRAAACDVEKEGMRRARQLIAQADIHLYLIDASQPLHPEDLHNLADMPKDRCLVLLNKSDLPGQIKQTDLSDQTLIKTSLLHSQGITELKTAILKHLRQTEGTTAPSSAAISSRHKAILKTAKADLEQALFILSEDREDLLAAAAEATRLAAEAIGQLLGKTYYPELLDTIFSRFCIGK